MIHKQTVLIPSDLCGVWLVRVFHLYRGFSRKVTRIGEFVKVSVRVTRPKNWIKKKKKLVAILFKTKYGYFKKDGSYIRFKMNSCILLKRRMTPKGNEIFGPVPLILKRRRFINRFSGRI